MIRLLAILVVFAQPAIRDLLSGRWRTRGNTLFSVRVDPAFAASDTARAIMKTFRLRVWIWTALIALVLAVAPADVFHRSHWLMLALLVTLAGNTVAFALANRAVTIQASPVAPPSTRTAILHLRNEPGSVGNVSIALVEWCGMLFPLVPPVVASILLIPRASPSVFVVPMLAISFAIAILQTQTVWSLRFGARESDWAADPALSRRYRAYSGLINTLIFGFLSLNGCTLLLVPPGRMFTYFAFALPGQLIVTLAAFQLRGWLKRHTVESSSDPMPDDSWKWGQFYFNPSDPALVVPARSDVGFSPNFARPAVLITWTIAHIGVFGGFAYVFGITLHSM
jgi:hypothetical protein